MDGMAYCGIDLYVLLAWSWGMLPGMKLTLLAYADAIRTNVAKAVPNIRVVIFRIFVPSSTCNGWPISMPILGSGRIYGDKS